MARILIAHPSVTVLDYFQDWLQHDAEQAHVVLRDHRWDNLSRLYQPDWYDLVIAGGDEKFAEWRRTLQAAGQKVLMLADDLPRSQDQLEPFREWLIERVAQMLESEAA